MNWEAIGAVGEIIGALAVVISLVYLATQIRVQNRESRAAAMHEISVGFRDSVATFAIRENAELLGKALDDPDTLSVAEKIQLFSGLQRILRVWEEAFHQFNEGRLDAKVWNVMVAQYSSLMSSKAYETVWALRKQNYDPDFREFVDTLERTGYGFE